MRRAFLLGILLLATARTAAAQECVTCWGERCVDAQDWLPACNAPAPKGKTVAAKCPAGQQRAGALCCFPGQKARAGLCNGAPRRCPPGWKAGAATCLLVDPSAVSNANDKPIVGIGVVIRSENGELVVRGLVPNAPSSYADLLPGDRIVGVDGQPTSTMSTNDATALIRGPAGVPVTLVVERAGERRPPVTIVRRPFTPPPPPPQAPATSSAP